jgi:hypothetical protein
MLQLINQHKEFQATACKSFISQFQLEQSAVHGQEQDHEFLNYHVLAVFGSQSSGKSAF